MKRRTAIVAGPGEAGRTVIDLLAARFTYQDRTTWQAAIAAGSVLVNQLPARPENLLQPGDTLEYLFPDLPEPPVNDGYVILFQDRDLLVIDKPANLPCHPGGRYFNHTLWAALSRDLEPGRLDFAHRLDRETSGLVLLARTREASRDLHRQFMERRVGKLYLALVEGIFPERLDACGHLVEAPESSLRKKRRFVTRSASGQSCRTLLRRLDTWHAADGCPLSLVEAEPITGRCHQIRATLAGLGFPVVGDKMYGRDETVFQRFIADRLTARDRSILRLDRQGLHSAALRFTHPATGRPMHFEIPLPDDMSGLRVTDYDVKSLAGTSHGLNS